MAGKKFQEVSFIRVHDLPESPSYPITQPTISYLTDLCCGFSCNPSKKSSDSLTKWWLWCIMLVVLYWSVIEKELLENASSVWFSHRPLIFHSCIPWILIVLHNMLLCSLEPHTILEPSLHLPPDMMLWLLTCYLNHSCRPFIIRTLQYIIFPCINWEVIWP